VTTTPESIDAKSEISETPDAPTSRAWDEFVKHIKKDDARITRARKTVFDLVMSRHDHFRADDLAAELARGPARVSRGTIYRTLALMVQTGFVREVRDSDTHVHYEHIYGHHRHEHMVCETCGLFIEFLAPEISESIEMRCQQQGFIEHNHRVTVFGICKTCAQKAGQ
jgi:Fur family transcriptional regulator, ferric uptake regulator